MKTFIPETLRKRLDVETGTTFKSWSQNLYRVALIYPNSYSTGMGNLGFQTVYHLINQRSDCLCERFFLPDKEDMADPKIGHSMLVSYESGRLLKDFDLIALSISFENDYLNLPWLFREAGLPLFASDRTQGHPLVLFGGVCAFINPEPIADLVDVVAVGEAEVILPQLLGTLVKHSVSREDLLSRLLQLPGLYLPAYYRPLYNDAGLFEGVSVLSPAPERVHRLYVKDLDRTPSQNFIRSREFEFGDMALVEVSRGCSRGCRFCAAGYVYLPPRERNLDPLLEQIKSESDGAGRVGLVAAAVADYSAIGPLKNELLSLDKKITSSSLRLDALTAEDVTQLKLADHRTVAIAPEAGSQRIRDFINKGVTQEQILDAVKLLADGGIRNLKLYFMIGFATEEIADVEAIVSLSREIVDIWRQAGQKRGVLGSVTISVNPFVPKPFTPLQWDGMDSEKNLKKKYRLLQSQVRPIANLNINSESIRMARMQAFLSRGDRRVGRLLVDLGENRNLKQVCKKHGLDPEIFISRQYEADVAFPWEVIDQGIERRYLWNEHQRAYQGVLTSPCTPGCQRCGVCTER